MFWRASSEAEVFILTAGNVVWTAWGLLATLACVKMVWRASREDEEALSTAAYAVRTTWGPLAMLSCVQMVCSEAEKAIHRSSRGWTMGVFGQSSIVSK